jgi:hypothetical protein
VLVTPLLYLDGMRAAFGDPSLTHPLPMVGVPAASSPDSRTGRGISDRTITIAAASDMSGPVPIQFI